MSRVCIVLPTYNRAGLLARAVRSVLQQTFTDWELRIVDDGSTDNTRTLVAEWTAKHANISYIFQDNRGVSAARNRAIFATSAPWIACLDSDDEWLPNKLERQLAFAEQFPHLRLIHTEETWLRGGAEVRPLKKHKKVGGPIFISCLPLCRISPSTVMIQTDLVKSLGGFREDFPVCEDYDLWLKICAQESVGLIEEPLTKKYGGHDDQLGFRRNLDEYRARALWDIRFHPNLSDPDREAVYVELLKKCKILIKGYEKHGHLEKAKYWREIQSQALDHCHQRYKAHSVADLAPRSESSLSLNGN